jgi:hypothetical protein
MQLVFRDKGVAGWLGLHCLLAPIFFLSNGPPHRRRICKWLPRIVNERLVVVKSKTDLLRETAATVCKMALMPSFLEGYGIFEL